MKESKSAVLPSELKVCLLDDLVGDVRALPVDVKGMPHATMRTYSGHPDHSPEGWSECSINGGITRTLSLAASTLVVLAGIASAATRSITGFGATARAWNATHAMDRRGNLVPGCCYDPVANRPGVLYGDRYYAVQRIGGHVSSYYEWLGNGTSASKAKAAALRELPSDARVRSFNVHGNSCAILIVDSRKLGNALGRGGAEVVVEFGSGADESHYNARSVNNLLFSSGIIAGSTAQNC